jgi:hypothetical protein
MEFKQYENPPWVDTLLKLIKEKEEAQNEIQN